MKSEILYEIVNKNRINKFTDENNSISIIIPCFMGHLKYIQRFLESNNKYNNDKNITNIYIIVSSYEVIEFENKLLKYGNIYILNFKELILKYFNTTIDENKFLELKGKETFQSLKKMCGMLECTDNNIFLTDSETYFIRNCNLLNEVANSNTVLYSYICSNETQYSVLNTTKNLLNINGDIPWVGLTFSYQWIFFKKYIIDFYKIFKNRIIETIINNSVPFFFIEIALYSYFYINKLNYNFIDVTKLLAYTDAEHFWGHTTYDNNDKNTINKIISIHNLFCYSVQNTCNDSNNNNIIKDYRNIKILTSTPSNFII